MVAQSFMVCSNHAGLCFNSLSCEGQQLESQSCHSIIDRLFLNFIFKRKNQHNLPECISQIPAFCSSPYASGESQQLMNNRSIETKIVAAYSPNPTMDVKRRASMEQPYIFLNNMFPVTHILSDTWLREKSSLQGRQKTKAGLNNGKTDLQVCQWINYSIQRGAVLFIICEHL